MWVSGSCASCLPQGLLCVGAAFQLSGSGDLFPRIQAKSPGQLVGVLPVPETLRSEGPVYLSPITGQIPQSHVNV